MHLHLLLRLLVRFLINDMGYLQSLKFQGQELKNAENMLFLLLELIAHRRHVSADLLLVNWTDP